MDVFSLRTSVVLCLHSVVPVDIAHGFKSQINSRRSKTKMIIKTSGSNNEHNYHRLKRATIVARKIRHRPFNVTRDMGSTVKLISMCLVFLGALNTGDIALYHSETCRTKNVFLETSYDCVVFICTSLVSCNNKRTILLLQIFLSLF